MVDLGFISCLFESEKESIEISLKKRIEQLIKEGDFKSANAVEANLGVIKKMKECEDDFMKMMG